MEDLPAQDRRNPLIAGFTNGSRRLAVLNPDLALQVCERIAGGERLRAICKDPKMPSAYTFIQWTLMHPEVHTAFTAAKQLSSFAKDELAEEKLEELIETPGTPQKVAAYRAYVNHLRWAAERRNAAEYGARAPVNIAVPIQINTNLALDPASGTPIDQEAIYDLRAEIASEQKADEDADVEALPVYTAHDHALLMEDKTEKKARIAQGRAKRWQHKRKLKPKEGSDPAPPKAKKKKAAVAEPPPKGPPWPDK